MNNNNLKLDIKDYMTTWNFLYPIDRWWRMKYNIPFGSKKHLKANHVDMVFEYIEEKHFFELSKKNNDVEDLEFDDNEKQQFNIPKEQFEDKNKMSEQEIDYEFDNLKI